MPGQFIEAPISTWQSITVRSALNTATDLVPAGIAHSVVTVRVVVVRVVIGLRLVDPERGAEGVACARGHPADVGAGLHGRRVAELYRLIERDGLVQGVRHAQFERAGDVLVPIRRC